MAIGGLQARPRGPHPSPAHQSLPALARRIMGDPGLYVTKPVTDVNRAVTAYSITLSARATSAGGTVTPSALAVLRLIASSNFVGCSIGISVTLTPRYRCRRWRA